MTSGWDEEFASTERLDASPVPAMPSMRELELVVLAGPDKGKRFRLHGPIVQVGKGAGNDVALSDPSVSRHHFAIEDTPGGYRLVDRASTNGTSVNGVVVKEGVLEPGAVIALGRTRLKVQPKETPLRVLPSSETSYRGLIGESLRMRELFAYLAKVGPTGITVLLTGETGTGKEEVARALHEASPRASKPLVVFDCSAVDPNLVGAALLGHVEGAFTGAVGQRKGAFQAANGGTLFLDEIGELPLDLQPKLLRVLERREVQPLGADAPVRVDVRLVSATHRSLPKMVEEGRFRQDLFYRLSALTLSVPPLRERPEDVMPLARHFAERARPGTTISDAARASLIAHDWPGNVRELRNVIDRAIALSDDVLEAADLMLAPPRTTSEAPSSELPSLSEVERAAILRVLVATRWNKSQSARVLGITPKTLREKIQRYGLVR